MMESKPKILIISSASPSIGPAVIGLDYYKAFKQEGYDVDFLTKYSEPEHPEFFYVFKNPSPLRKKINHYIERVRWHLGIFRPDGYEFFYKDELKPPVSTEKVLAAIERDYDIVFVLFWQRLLSFKTINDIYDKLHCKFVFAGVDYSQMSGGCHFTGNCERYKVGCGKCPAFHSNDEHDFTYQNVLYRKMVYEKVKPIVFGNQYMCEFYKRSFLLKDYPFEISDGPIIDTSLFCPKDRGALRREYRISAERFVIFFGCQHLDNPRKGISHLVEALNILYDNLSDTERKKLLVIMAGRQYDKIELKIPFESKGYGLVPITTLPDIYALADCFICPSVDDAGPMMVNQSICCGTPVVGFDMGAVKQLIKAYNLGYVAKLRDARDMAIGIKAMFDLIPEDYTPLSQKCREVGVKLHSYKNKVAHLMSVISLSEINS